MFIDIGSMLNMFTGSSGGFGGMGGDSSSAGDAVSGKGKAVPSVSDVNTTGGFDQAVNE